MSGKKTPTKRNNKAKAGPIANALSAGKARLTVKARRTETPPEPKLITPRDLEILEYAEAMTDSTRRVTDALMERVRRFFDEDAIIELTGLIAFQNLSSKFNSALDVPAQGFCRLPGGAGAY